MYITMIIITIIYLWDIQKENRIMRRCISYIILIERMEEMLLIENKKGLKTYTIINKYLCECGLLNEKNVCNACMKYMKRKTLEV